ncbi:hypothetical protein HDU96_005651 [Phlyctochytrium bullatum]|nr:hypothetical protein HDU96_005651 [Phlyctochytrium bullatum]
MSKALAIKIGAILLAMSAAAVQALPADLNRLEENVFAASDCDSFGSVAVNRCIAVAGAEGEACYDLAMQSRRQCREDLANSRSAKFRFEFVPGTATPSSDATEPSTVSDNDDNDLAAIQQRLLKVIKYDPYQVKAQFRVIKDCPPRFGKGCCSVEEDKPKCGRIKGIPEDEKKRCENQLEDAASEYALRENGEPVRFNELFAIPIAEERSIELGSRAGSPEWEQCESSNDVLANPSAAVKCREDLANSRTAKFRFEFVPDPGTATPSSDEATEPSKASDGDDNDLAAIQQRGFKKDKDPFNVLDKVSVSRECGPSNKNCCKVDEDKKRCDGIHGARDWQKEACKTALGKASSVCNERVKKGKKGRVDATYEFVKIYDHKDPSLYSIRVRTKKDCAASKKAERREEAIRAVPPQFDGRFEVPDN